MIKNIVGSTLVLASFVVGSLSIIKASNTPEEIPMKIITTSATQENLERKMQSQAKTVSIPEATDFSWDKVWFIKPGKYQKVGEEIFSSNDRNCTMVFVEDGELIYVLSLAAEELNCSELKEQNYSPSEALFFKDENNLLTDRKERS